MNQYPKILFAKSFTHRLIGLMGRNVWPGDHEGIYFPRCRAVHTFFTFLRPDLLFLDKNHKILRVYLSAKPWSVFVGPTQTYGCFEIPSGVSRHWGLKEGDVIEWLRQ